MNEHGDRRRITWAILGAVAVLVAFAAADVLRSSDPEQAGQATTREDQRAPTTIATEENASTEPATTSADGVQSPRFERLVRRAGDIQFSFRVDASWERFQGISLNKSIVGPQGAEAIIFWAGFPEGGLVHLCGTVLSPRIDPSVADLAAAVANARGTELVSAPSDVTIDGRSAKRVVLTVRKQVGCDPGFFYSWQDDPRGALWSVTSVGDTIRVWVVDVEGRPLFIEAETSRQADLALVREVRQIVRSIRIG